VHQPCHQDASSCAVEQPGDQNAVGERADVVFEERRWIAEPSSLRQWQVPQCPEQCQYQIRRQGAESRLEPGQGKTTPARFFTAGIGEEEPVCGRQAERDHDTGPPASHRNPWRGRLPSQHHLDRNREDEESGSDQDSRKVPPGMSSRYHQRLEKRTYPRRARERGRHDERRYQGNRGGDGHEPDGDRDSLATEFRAEHEHRCGHQPGQEEGEEPPARSAVSGPRVEHARHHHAGQRGSEQREHQDRNDNDHAAGIEGPERDQQSP